MKMFVWKCPVCGRKQIMYVPSKNVTCPPGKHLKSVDMELKEVKEK